MSIENIPATTAPISGRTADFNPDVSDPEMIEMVISYSYACTYCGAGIGEACIRVTDDVSGPARRARFPHATRGTDYIPAAKRQVVLDKMQSLIQEALTRIVEEMSTETTVVDQ